MEQKIIILSASTWELTTEVGELKKGCTVWYLPSDNFKPVINGNSAGYVPCKTSMPYEFFDVIKEKGGCPIVDLYINLYSNTYIGSSQKSICG